MTREEMKQIKENKKVMELCIKTNAKIYGYKTAMGFLYKVINNFIYELLINVNQKIYISIEYKPIILDNIFWEIFDMAEETKNKSLSFHVTGVFTAKTIKIKDFELSCNDKESMETKFFEIINYSNKIIEEHSGKINCLETFYESIIKDGSQYLNIILTDILNKNYEKALIKINECIKEYKNGGFMDKNSKSIIDYAKEYCEKRI